MFPRKVRGDEKRYPPRRHGRGHAHSVPLEGIDGQSQASEESIYELEALFVAALREAAADLSVADLDGVERVLALRAARAGLDRLPCPHCDGPMRRVGVARERHIQGVVGDYTLRRTSDLCDACRCGQAPLDAQMHRSDWGRGCSRPRCCARRAGGASRHRSRRRWTPCAPRSG